MALAWIWHRLTSGHKSVVVCGKEGSGYGGSASEVYEALKDEGCGNAYYLLDAKEPGRDHIKSEYRKNLIRRFSLRHYYGLFAASTIITEGDLEDCLESGAASERFRKQILHGSKNHVRLYNRGSELIEVPGTKGKRVICVPSAEEARYISETTGYKSREIWQTGSPEDGGDVKVAEHIAAKMKEDGLI